jgi:hypothetical protein
MASVTEPQELVSAIHTQQALIVCSMFARTIATATGTASLQVKAPWDANVLTNTKERVRK